MSYIDRNLLPEERILFRTKKHLILFFFPAIWTVFAIYASNYMRSEAVVLYKLSWIPWMLAFIFWGYAWLEYTFSEFAVTNKRVIMREGFFYRHVTEMRVATISQVNVDQSLLGVMLNFGTVSLNAFGAFDAYTLIDKPALFQKTVNEQLDTLTR